MAPPVKWRMIQGMPCVPRPAELDLCWSTMCDYMDGYRSNQHGEEGPPLREGMRHEEPEDDGLTPFLEVPGVEDSE